MLHLHCYYCVNLYYLNTGSGATEEGLTSRGGRHLSEGHPERFTELHGEEKREEGFRSDPNEMRRNQKRREQVSQ